jgi:hypothetical protein
MIEAEFTRAELFLTHCRWMDNLASLERCRELADPEADPALWTTITGMIWNSLRWGPIPAPEAISRIESDETEDEVRTIPRLANTSKLVAMLGRFDEARTRAQAGKHFWLERGMRMRAGGTFFDSAAVEVLAGDLAAADRELAEGIAILNEIGETGVLSTLAAMHAEVLFRLGRRDEMEAAIELAQKTGAPSDIATQANWRWVAAMAAADDGREADARSLIDEAIALVEPTDFLEMRASAFEALAHVEGRAGGSDAWRAALERALDEHVQKGNLVDTQRVRDLLEKGPDDRNQA